MIYAIVGTKKEVREKSVKELALLGTRARYVYSEQAKDIKPLIDGASLFGDTIVVTCFSLGESASSKEILVENLEEMSTSNTIFIVDEPFGDVHMFNRLRKVAKKVFDAREEKIKDVSVFSLCTFFAARNKKDAWVTFLDVKKRESGEAIAGALWWKFQTVWQGAIIGKRSLFTEEECKSIGKDLMLAPVLAHRGEKDLMIELERIILSI